MSLQHMWLLCYGRCCADGAAGFIQTLLFVTVFNHRCFPHTVFHCHHYPNNQIYPLLPYAITSVLTPTLIALPFPLCASVSVSVYLTVSKTLAWTDLKTSVGFRCYVRRFLLTPLIAHAALILSTTRCSAIETLCSFMIGLLQNLLTLPSKSAPIASVQFHWRQPVTESCSKRLQRPFLRSVVDSLGFGHCGGESLALRW